MQKKARTHSQEMQTFSVIHTLLFQMFPVKREEQYRRRNRRQRIRDRLREKYGEYAPRIV
jgi:hypothetical protein